MDSESAVLCINATSKNLKVDYDPNWDDQQLTINCKLNTSCECPPAQAVKSSVDFQDEGNDYALGIMFSLSNSNGYQMTVGQGSDGLMGITESDTWGPTTFKYTIINQTAWTITLLFEDN